MNKTIMDKRSVEGKRSLENKRSLDVEDKKSQAAGAGSKKMSEYGRQLSEKQKVKHMYGLREKQFRRFFKIAVRAEGAPGENLLSMLESRLDNTVYRLKMASTRIQARQLVVHGHIRVNGKKVSSPSYFVKTTDVVSLSESSAHKKQFMEQVIEKRMKTGIKVPEWLEFDKKTMSGNVLRKPARTDIQAPIEEHLIVELYSK